MNRHYNLLVKRMLYIICVSPFSDKYSTINIKVLNEMLHHKKFNWDLYEFVLDPAGNSSNYPCKWNILYLYMFFCKNVFKYPYLRKLFSTLPILFYMGTYITRLNPNLCIALKFLNKLTSKKPNSSCCSPNKLIPQPSAVQLYPVYTSFPL